MDVEKTTIPIQRAVISVSDKNGVVEFARFLSQHGVQIFSTGGTASLLTEQGVANTGIEEYTGFPEMMDGRLKTLHPKVHGGLLGRQDIDAADMAQYGIESFDLLVVNLYPFEETIAKPSMSYAECIEQIDIGGPAMIRAAAKNHQRVSVVVDSEDYTDIQAALTEHGGIPFAMRARFAMKAFQRVAQYDTVIAAWFERALYAEGSSSISEQLPEHICLPMSQVQSLRYGENPHQRAAFYGLQALQDGEDFPGIKKIQGKPLSYNNIVDADTAYHCCEEYDAPACVIVKHVNPCGVACAKNLMQAYQRAVESDPVSVFGGVIAFNRSISVQLAQALVQGPFTEAIIAPQIEADACAILTQKPSLRVMQGCFHQDVLAYKSIAGGLLVQERDRSQEDADSLCVKTNHSLTAQQIKTLLFAWSAVRYVQSNAIVVAHSDATACYTIGIGGGQTSRVDAVRFALGKVGDLKDKKNLVLASDAFFPFSDSIELAAQAGIGAIIQPGGSVKDKEVIAAAQEHSIAMVFVGVRHFRH